MNDALLRFAPKSSLEACNAGLFISPGQGRHPTRVIDSSELIFVKSGTLGVFEDESEYALGPGQCLLLAAGHRHGGTAEYLPGLQFYWLHFRLKRQNGKGRLELPKTALLKRPERMTELFRMYLDEQESGSLLEPRANALVELMLLEILERKDESAAASDSEERLASSAENAMRERFRDPKFSASGLAKALACNPDYLNRAFRRSRGQTLTAFLQRLRANYAAQLLLEGKLNAEEAALQSGFSERGYMRRVFKRIKGMTPKEYRQLHLRMHVNSR